jgi:hypothetical protein
MKLIGLILMVLFLWSAARGCDLARDPVYNAWACRCDTCCQYLDRVLGGE